MGQQFLPGLNPNINNFNTPANFQILEDYATSIKNPNVGYSKSFNPPVPYREIPNTQYSIGRGAIPKEVIDPSRFKMIGDAPLQYSDEVLKAKTLLNDIRNPKLPVLYEPKVQPTYNQQVEAIDKAIDDYILKQGKKIGSAIKGGAKTTGQTIKGALKAVKPTAKLVGGKILPAAGAIFDTSVLFSDAPMDEKIAAGLGLAGTAASLVPIPIVKGAGLGTAYLAGLYPAAKAGVKKFVDNKQDEYLRGLSDEELEALLNNTK